MTGDPTYPLEYKLIPWIIVVILFFLSALIILVRNKKITPEFELMRKFNLVSSLSLSCVALIRIFFIFSDFERVARGKTLIHFRLLYFGYFIGYLGLFSVIFYFDHFIVKTPKHVLSLVILGYTIFSGIMLFIFTFLSEILNLFRYFVYSGVYVSLIIIGLILIKIMSAIDFKRLQKTIYGASGYFFIIIGLLFDTDMLYDLIYKQIPLLALLPPILSIIGIVLFTIYFDVGFKVLLEYYTTKKICLVHRGLIEGKIYFCPNCLVKYCEDCFKSVILKDNCCWACEEKINPEENEVLLKKLEDVQESPVLKKKSKN